MEVICAMSGEQVEAGAGRRQAASQTYEDSSPLSGARRHLPAGLSIFCALAFIFVLGLALGYLREPPANLVGDALVSFKDLEENRGAYFFGVPTQHLEPKRYPGSGVTLSKPEQTQSGVTFMTGLFGNKLGARLYSADGRLLHEWPLDFFKIAPDAMRYPFDALIHGDVIYENGDVIANLESRGMVRFSACGNIAWQNLGQTHHSISIDDEGFLWAPVDAPEYHDPAIASEPFRFDRIAKFDPITGEKVDEIDLVRLLHQQDSLGLITANEVTTYDMMHLNDVEVLTADKAKAFRKFSAGDLLLSSRHYNQLWVLDGKTHAIKWTFMGPMLSQHDPDFEPNGTITVLDNRPTHSGEMRADPQFVGDRGGSRILSINPNTGRWRTLYQSDERNTFYTPYRGKNQTLENGNMLITETDGGRVFEVTPKGEVVWSFVNAYDDKRVGWIMSATRLPSRFGAIGNVSCAVG
jgi:hypothetical protein